MEPETAPNGDQDRIPTTAATLERVTVALARYISHDENPPVEAVIAHREAAQLLWGPRQEASDGE